MNLPGFVMTQSAPPSQCSDSPTSQREDSEGVPRLSQPWTCFLGTPALQRLAEGGRKLLEKQQQAAAFGEKRRQR